MCTHNVINDSNYSHAKIDSRLKYNLKNKH